MKHSSLFTFAATALFLMVSLLVYNHNNLDDTIFLVLALFSAMVIIVSLMLALTTKQWGIFIKPAVASVVSSFPTVVAGLWLGQGRLIIWNTVLDASLWAFPAFVLMFSTYEWLEEKLKKKEKTSP
jgi:hypothetical protein